MEDFARFAELVQVVGGNELDRNIPDLQLVARLCNLDLFDLEACELLFDRRDRHYGRILIDDLLNIVQ